MQVSIAELMSSPTPPSMPPPFLQHTPLSPSVSRLSFSEIILASKFYVGFLAGVRRVVE